ncbi:MAG: NAD(+)/NADH kinase [Sphaerochaetaceae bacterium]|nr:NAD(+)/NADH kinase [Spirochaetales bacterium]MDY5500722.1 NAD(+)/NADH kinase [Sphaerochaetaceae bacterium]
MEKPKQVIIVENGSKEQSKSLGEEIRKYLSELSIPATVVRTIGTDQPLDVPEETELAISLGGDGTVLYCARYLHDLGIPIIAINLGTFGYITEISKDEWKDTLDAYLAGKLQLSRRLMVRVDVVRGHRKVFSCMGLNEMVVTSSGISKVVNLRMELDDIYAGTFRADGMIVATPTGSTGYSLAAGGPILDVSLDDLIVTPVCPFSLSNRPLVVNGETEVSIEVLHGQRTGLMLTVDGQQNFPLEEGDEVTVEKARSKVLIVHSPHRSSVDIIREKLGWSRGGWNHA